MIGYIEGRLLKKEPERILVLANQIGYEVLLPAFVADTLRDRAVGEKVALYIYYQQTERQPKPVLIGFNSEIEKAFFVRFISVEAIGALKAVKALTLPLGEIAEAIESRNIAKLKRLKGIGERTAQKIIAALRGKMDMFSDGPQAAPERNPETEKLNDAVFAVLVDQLGYHRGEARKMIAAALTRRPDISTPEMLLDEVFRGE